MIYKESSQQIQWVMQVGAGCAFKKAHIIYYFILFLVEIKGGIYYTLKGGGKHRLIYTILLNL